MSPSLFYRSINRADLKFYIAASDVLPSLRYYNVQIIRKVQVSLIIDGDPLLIFPAKKGQIKNDNNNNETDNKIWYIIEPFA